MLRAFTLLFLAAALLVTAEPSCSGDAINEDAAATTTGVAVKPRLFYFGVRGRGEPIRLLLKDANVDYDEVKVSKSDGVWNQIEGMPTIPDHFPFKQVYVYRHSHLFVLHSISFSF
jgi:hypothetical protein